MIESFATTSKRKESVIGQSILRTFLLVCIECTYIRDRHLVIDDSIYMTVRYYVFTSFYLNIISYLRFRHQRVFHLNDVTSRFTVQAIPISINLYLDEDRVDFPIGIRSNHCVNG